MFTAEERRCKFCLFASPDGSDGSVTAYQNVKLYAALLAPGDEFSYRFKQFQDPAYILLA